MVIELRVVQFWSEIMLVISNRTPAARSFDFEITCMISDQIALHSVQLPYTDKSIKIGKYDLIDIDCIDQSVEIEDTLVSFIDLLILIFTEN